MEQIIGIYKITNIKNNKIYIGQSINIYQRWKNHKYSLMNNNHFNSHLQNAWNKYGEDNFEFSIVEICLPNRLNDREKYYISFFNSNSVDGYNISAGGNDSVISEETRQKMSLSHIGLLGTEESKKKQSLKLSGKNNPMYGKCGNLHPSYHKKRSLETCMNIKKSFTEERIKSYHDRMVGFNNPMYNCIGEDNPASKKVICVETGVIFNTEKDAANWCGLKTHTNISNVCNGKRKHAGRDPNTGILLSWKFY